MIIYVNINAPKDGNGSKESPFKSISEAAAIARPCSIGAGYMGRPPNRARGSADCGAKGVSSGANQAAFLDGG